jgi:ferrous iron transport protein A
MMKTQTLKSLNEVSTGAKCVVRQLKGGNSFVGRLGALGFTVGSLVQVIRNSGKGPLLVLVRKSRMALGRGEALKVLIEEIGSDPAGGDQAQT